MVVVFVPKRHVHYSTGMAKKMLLVCAAVLLSWASAGSKDFGHMSNPTPITTDGSKDFGDR